MKYVLVFEYEPDPEAEPEFRDGMDVYRISGLDCNYHIKGTIRKLPSRRPNSDYRYNTYQEGYDKGVNDTLDHLEGYNGEYKPSIDAKGQMAD
jgi:hypothetical protein